MAEILMAAALAACSQDPTACSYTELRSGEAVIAVCDVSPGDQGPPISYEFYLGAKKHTLVLEPTCLET